MTIIPAIDVFKNIHQQQDLTDEKEHELHFLLDSALRQLETFVKSGKYDTQQHGLTITTAASGDENLTKQLNLGLADFPFLHSWTVGEFAAFMGAHQEFLALKKPRKQRGRPKKTSDDVAKQHKEFREQIAQVLPGIRYNMMTGEFQHLRFDDNTGRMYYYSLHGDDLNLLGERLLLDHGIRIPDDIATKIFKIIAKEPQNIYYPQVEMLDMSRGKNPGMLVEQAHEFFKGFGTKMFGAFKDEPTINGVPLRDAALKKFLVAMAKLARNPGITPQWMPILIGGQGAGKSFFVKHLVPPMFKDLAGEIKTDMSRIRNEAYRLHTAFVHEFPEIDSQFCQRNVESLKNLVTGDVDEVRRPYAALPERLVRQFAFIGTSNREDIFVEGAGQRRYVPIQLPMRHRIPWPQLRDTDLVWEMWAAADVIAQTYDKHDIYLRSWSKEEEDIIFGWQTRFAQVDPLEHSVVHWVSTSGRRRFTTAELMSGININLGSGSDQASGRRVANILRSAFGDSCKKVFITLSSGRKVRGWEIVMALDDIPQPVTDHTLKSVPIDENDF